MLIRSNMKITIERLGRWLPVPVVALDRMPGRLIGLSLGAFVVVRTDYADDRPTIVHELEHCKQFWRGGLVMHMVRYYISQHYRLRTELEAFRAELAACTDEVRHQRLEESVRVLSSCYQIGQDADSCRRMLSVDVRLPVEAALACLRHDAPQSVSASTSTASPVAARSAPPETAH